MDNRLSPDAPSHLLLLVVEVLSPFFFFSFLYYFSLYYYFLGHHTGAYMHLHTNLSYGVFWGCSTEHGGAGSDRIGQALHPSRVIIERALLYPILFFLTFILMGGVSH